MSCWGAVKPNDYKICPSMGKNNREETRQVEVAGRSDTILDASWAAAVISTCLSNSARSAPVLKTVNKATEQTM
jgi:hypothetical protein